MPPATLALPAGDYCVLHVGASTPLKLWGAEKWRGLAESLERRGLRVVFSAGPREGAIIDDIDPEARRPRFAGNLSLPQVWHLIAGARLVVCPDTGVAHLARVAGVPVVVIFGGGSASLFGGGEFWRDARERKITLPNFPCRDENVIFRRQVPWAGNCARTPDKCPSARCMQGISLETVADAASALLERKAA
jgi:ADP-heptose:LPS heptosyltransferase